MTDAYIHSPKSFFELGPADRQLDTLTTRTLGARMMINHRHLYRYNVQGVADEWEEGLQVLPTF